MGPSKSRSYESHGHLEGKLEGGLRERPFVIIPLTIILFKDSAEFSSSHNLGIVFGNAERSSFQKEVSVQEARPLGVR